MNFNHMGYAPAQPRTELMRMDVNPSAGAHTVEPLTVTEIDNHPDCDRIWATVLACRNARNVH